MINLKYNFKILILGTLFLFSILSIFSTTKINANPLTECLPDTCREPGQYEPDFNCINQRFLDPSLDCCPNKCVGGQSSVEEPVVLQEFNIFGTTIGLDFSNANTLPTLINIGISTVLGIISFYALFRGVYIAAFVRTSTTDASKIAAVNTELKNLIIGFIIAWAAIFIVQLIANIIGLGSLQNLQITGTEGSFLITIK